MKILNLKDKNFYPDKYSARQGTSSLIGWDRSCSQVGPTVYTDRYLRRTVGHKPEKKIAWLLEPIVINPSIYPWIRSNYGLFDEVWTHDEEVLNAVENSKWVPMGGTWIEAEARRIYPKSKVCSFIASDKNWAPGHQLRQGIRASLPNSVDSFGKGFNFLSRKADGLINYCFSIAIENCVRDTYFTEKLIDCFNTGTIPIYWGTRNVDQYFNPDGIIHFSDVDALLEIIMSLSLEKYSALLNAVKENFELAKEFETAENWILKYS